MILPSPTWAWMRPTASSMIETGVQVGVTPQMRYRKFLSSSCPYAVWRTSGWNWTP